MDYLIRGQLATLNDHDKANRANRFFGAKVKQENTDLVTWQLKGKEVITKPCRIGFIWYYANRCDFDNIRFACKYVLDGMVKAGILPDDNPKWVRGFDGDDFVKVPPDQTGVKIIVTELEE